MSDQKAFHPKDPPGPPRGPPRAGAAADTLIATLEQGLRCLYGVDAAGSGRTYPAEEMTTGRLSREQRRRSQRLMRVNHAGEVCAQALYRGQAAAARTERQRGQLLQAAREEEDHLLWCRRRLRELGTDPSRLGPLWYLGSYAIGFAAGLAGDRLSLGFLAETERQVARHLENHIQQLSEQDERSRVVLKQMQADELRHGQHAQQAGARELPLVARQAMRLCSKVMTTVACRF